MNKFSVLTFSILTVCVWYPFYTHAAYGGGWWGWWWVFVTNTVLRRDVCKNGDASSSYFDWTCEKNETYHEAAPKTKSVTKDVQKELKTLITTITKSENKFVKNKTEFNKKPTKKYRKAQIKIDSIMNRREKLSKSDKEVKLYTLLELTQNLSENKKITWDLLLVVSYVHEKSLSMAKKSLGVQ